MQKSLKTAVPAPTPSAKQQKAEYTQSCAAGSVPFVSDDAVIQPVHDTSFGRGSGIWIAHLSRAHSTVPQDMVRSRQQL